MPKRAGKPLERLFPNASPKAIDNKYKKIKHINLNKSKQLLIC